MTTPHLVLTRLATNTFALHNLTDPEAADPTAVVTDAAVTVTLNDPDGVAVFEDEVCTPGSGVSSGRYRYAHFVASNWASGGGYTGSFHVVLPSGGEREFPFTAEVLED